MILSTRVRMKYIFDTHTLIWFLERNPRLGTYLVILPDVTGRLIRLFPTLRERVSQLILDSFQWLIIFPCKWFKSSFVVSL
jgi:hypothetical protein